MTDNETKNARATGKATTSIDRLREAWRQQAIAEAGLAIAQTREAELDAARGAIYFADAQRDERLSVNRDVNNRTYNFNDVVEEHSVAKAVDHISAWARFSAEPITLRYNSPGGNVYDGLAMYDHLRAIVATRAPLITVSIGMSASMAGILVQAGSRRVVTANAQFMIHEVADWSFFRVTSATSSEDEAKLLRDLNNRLFGILVEGSQRAFKAGTAKVELTVEAINERAKRREWWLNSEELVYFGLADEVGYV